MPPGECVQSHIALPCVRDSATYNIIQSPQINWLHSCCSLCSRTWVWNSKTFTNWHTKWKLCFRMVEVMPRIQNSLYCSNKIVITYLIKELHGRSAHCRDAERSSQDEWHCWSCLCEWAWGSPVCAWGSPVWAWGSGQKKQILLQKLVVGKIQNTLKANYWNV